MKSERKIAINCDMGESYGIYTLGKDEEIMQHINVANVACGFHAGDPSVMSKTIEAAKRFGVAVGAHPSLPDRQGFGRREMKIQVDELKSMLTYQVGALRGFLELADMELNHLKVHGALYGMSSRDRELAVAIADVAKKFQVPVYGLADTMHEEAAALKGVEFVSEFYADLDYSADGMLVITREHEERDPQAAAERVRRAITDGLVVSTDGVDTQVRVDTVCVHSDTPNAAELAAVVAGVVKEINDA